MANNGKNTGKIFPDEISFFFKNMKIVLVCAGACYVLVMDLKLQISLANFSVAVLFTY